MRVCIVVEGCYPYVAGGVSSWIHGLIQSFPKVEFVLQTIISTRDQSGRFIYQLPENVTEVAEPQTEPPGVCCHAQFGDESSCGLGDVV